MFFTCKKFQTNYISCEQIGPHSLPLPGIAWPPLCVPGAVAFVCEQHISVFLWMNYYLYQKLCHRYGHQWLIWKCRVRNGGHSVQGCELKFQRILPGTGAPCSIFYCHLLGSVFRIAVATKKVALCFIHDVMIPSVNIPDFSYVSQKWLKQRQW